jgi:hypothetical protein
MKIFYSGWRLSGVPRPSSLTTVAVSTAEPGITQDRTALPSMCCPSP